MALKKPQDGALVWIEYPEGRRFQARYAAVSDTYHMDGEAPIDARNVANWSHHEHEDTDISDWLNQPTKGKFG